MTAKSWTGRGAAGMRLRRGFLPREWTAQPAERPCCRSRASWALIAFVLFLAALGGFLLTGCASAPCVPEIITVPSPPEVVTVLPPMPVIPSAPEVRSTSPEGLVLAAEDPASWLRLLAADLLRALDAYRAAADELAALAQAARDADEGDPR